MRVLGVIPARLESTRLPGKLLLAETGRPLIQYVWEAASRAAHLDRVVVATDSPRIADVVRGFGGRAELTGQHPSGTDRIAEVVRRAPETWDVVVNIQGDEPEIDPAQIDALVETLVADPGADLATLATPIRARDELDDPSCVKVVTGVRGRALYFSRCPVPFVRDADPDALLAADSPWLLHLGVYAYRPSYLLELAARPPGRLERLEKLEQLRVLETGGTIRVAVVEHRAVGIDTPDDYARFVARCRQRAAA